MRQSMVTVTLSLLLMLISTGLVHAFDSGAQKKFQEYMDMTFQELAAASDAKLKEKYPDEDWSELHFPDYVSTDLSILTSYRIAVKEPELLGRVNVRDQQKVIPCYCTCQKFGHDNLLYCFWEGGKPGGVFDKHGSQCAVCMRQAFLAFLWSELGATHEEIMQGMEKKFTPLINMQEEGKIRDP